MLRRFLLTFSLLAGSGAAWAEMLQPAFDQPPHEYWTRPLTDRFTKLKGDLESGRVSIGGSDEKTFLSNLLKTLDIPVSSQMLVFSTTSLQLRFIKPSNPRALYFNEDVYVGYIPGGRLEIVSVDPALGGIFYIFDIPRVGERPRIERSNRCMNCHAAEDTAGVPGLVIKSVLPGVLGGSLDSYRRGLTGHAVPFAQRFGGWYVTGAEGLEPHLGNAQGHYVNGEIEKIALLPDGQFDYGRYLTGTTDVLPQLVHEHQIGFINRATTATYKTRALLKDEVAAPSAGAELDAEARGLTRYLLFADEAQLPNPIVGDSAYKTDFLREKRAVAGASLKDFDLQTRLFRYRCSYMIYSDAFTGLPPEMKGRVYRELGRALSPESKAPEYAYLSVAERQSIRTILRGTLKDLPTGW